MSEEVKQPQAAPGAEPAPATAQDAETAAPQTAAAPAGSDPVQPDNKPLPHHETHGDHDKEDKKLKKLEKELEALTAEKDKAAEELKSTKDLLLRTAAEYDNYRKRTEREKQSSISYGASGAVEKLLPVLDNLELAAAADTADEAYKKGVLMTLKMFGDSLKALGVEEIEGVGAPFDPAHHCAVGREASDKFDSGTVVSVMRKGYRMGDRIVRVSMVTVAE